mmetsp:Transcript_2261/g.5924  ORF Transcript_2261/g.5924 Transcript_2261/m.5924 type:complete len:205 (-) Transcript_2261:1012-1626(-)
MVLDGRASRYGLDHLDLALDETLVEAKHRERLTRTHARHAAGEARLSLIDTAPALRHRLAEVRTGARLGRSVDHAPGVGELRGEARRVRPHLAQQAALAEGVAQRRYVAQGAGRLVARALHPEASEAIGLLGGLSHQHSLTHVLVVEHGTRHSAAPRQARDDVTVIDDAVGLALGEERLEVGRELRVAHARRAVGVEGDGLPLG